MTALHIYVLVVISNQINKLTNLATWNGIVCLRLVDMISIMQLFNSHHLMVFISLALAREV